VLPPLTTLLNLLMNACVDFSNTFNYLISLSNLNYPFYKLAILPFWLVVIDWSNFILEFCTFSKLLLSVKVLSYFFVDIPYLDLRSSTNDFIFISYVLMVLSCLITLLSSECILLLMVKNNITDIIIYPKSARLKTLKYLCHSGGSSYLLPRREAFMSSS